MNLYKKFILMTLLLLISSFSFSLSYDFGIGGSLGYQTPQFPPYEGSSEFSWAGGGFLGAGLSINPKNLTHSFGLEYQAFYLKDYVWYKIGPGSVMEEQIREKGGSFRQNFDFYYKLGLIAGKLPLDIQFNLGVAVTNPLTFYYNSMKEDLRGTIGHGLHLGMRLSYSLAFLELNYAYIPGNSFYRGHEHLNLDKTDINANTFNISIGILFNKANLDYFLK